MFKEILKQAFLPEPRKGQLSVMMFRERTKTSLLVKPFSHVITKPAPWASHSSSLGDGPHTICSHIWLRLGAVPCVWGDGQGLHNSPEAFHKH
jgi:hypothetical protein